MIYTIDEISSRIRPVAEKYHLKAVYLFGSYARGEARDDSDVDLLVDLSGADLSGFFAIGGLYNDLEAALQKEIDLITTVALEQPCRRMSNKLFREIVNKERRKIYAVARFTADLEDTRLLSQHSRHNCPQNIEKMSELQFAAHSSS